MGFPYAYEISNSIGMNIHQTGFFAAILQPGYMVLNGTEYDSVLNYHTVPDYTYHKPSVVQQAEINKSLMADLYNQATNGDASAQYTPGMHYLKGDCCETNEILANVWIKSAAYNGDLDASNELFSLSAAVVAR